MPKKASTQVFKKISDCPELFQLAEVCLKK